MATATISPELSVMNIMRAVAGTATSVDGFDSLQRTTVATITADRNVGTC